jgi:hypothetical protein
MCGNQFVISLWTLKQRTLQQAAGTRASSIVKKSFAGMQNPKSQVPNPKEVPSSKSQSSRSSSASFDPWNLGFIWRLGFGFCVS